MEFAIVTVALIVLLSIVAIAASARAHRRRMKFWNEYLERKRNGSA